jgi:hypothetical protein
MIMLSMINFVIRQSKRYNNNHDDSDDNDKNQTYLNIHMIYIYLHFFSLKLTNEIS